MSYSYSAEWAAGFPIGTRTTKIKWKNKTHLARLLPSGSFILGIEYLNDQAICGITKNGREWKGSGDWRKVTCKNCLTHKQSTKNNKRKKK